MLNVRALRLPFAHSVKARFRAVVTAVWLLTLSIVVVLAVSAKTSEEDARAAARTDDETLDLLSFALVTYGYVDELEHACEDPAAAVSGEVEHMRRRFLAKLADLPTQQEARRLSLLDWNALRTAAERLRDELDGVEAKRAAGQLEAARLDFVRIRPDAFERRMLPWLVRAIDDQRSYSDSLEQYTDTHISTLRQLGNGFAVGLALLVAAVLWGTQRALMKPIGMLVRGTQAIARGDYTHRLGYRSENEFGILARRFDDMAATIENSQRVLLEKHQGLVQAYQLQAEFLSMMSHELRSPLHSILGYTELVLDDGALPSPTKRNIDNIALSARRLLALIDDILAFSKLRAGRMRFSVEEFHVLQLTTEVIDEARMLVKKRELDIQLDLTPEASSTVLQTDPIKVRQILTNLLSNAVKFTEKGSITLRVECRDDQVVFKVTDTGIGIPESQLERIFEPFKQVRVHAEGGTGLGLAIVSQLCQLLGGGVSVQSRSGVGSEFVVCLPINAESLHGQHTDPG